MCIYLHIFCLSNFIPRIYPQEVIKDSEMTVREGKEGMRAGKEVQRETKSRIRLEV